MTPVQVAALVAAWLAAARWSIPSTSATAATATAGTDPWTLHDPDFPVRVIVTPFADELWEASVAQDTDAALAIPSSVLNITVELPPITNVTTTQVSVALFGRPDPTREQQVPSRDAGSKTAEPANDNDHGVAVALIADTQMQYAKSYRLDVGTEPQRMVMRVYVESQLASGRTMRAMFVRPLDLSPSAPLLPECPRAREAEVALRVTSFPPPNMPPDLCSAYTMDGRVPVRKWYFDDQSDTERTYEERSFEFVEELIAAAREQKRFYYGPTDEFLYHALAKYPIRGQHVLIVGSTIPWYEAICVAAEAASCTTIDYNKLQYNHPKIQTYTVGEFESSAPRMQFDAIFSISSFEHDGLGRYGEPLDPDADLKAMRALLKYTKPPARANDATKVFLAVPVGADTVVWNAQRIYGPLRLPLLLQEWSLVDSFGFSKADFTAPFTVDHQPLFVLEPKAAEPATTEAGEHSEL